MGYRVEKHTYKSVNKNSEHKYTYGLDILNEKDSYDHYLIHIFMDMRDMNENGSYLMIILNGDVYEKLGLNQNQLFKNATKEIMGNKYRKVFDIKKDTNIDLKGDYEAHIKKIDKIWNLLLEMLENSGEDFYVD